MDGKIPSIYILASKPYGTIYTGVTTNLPKRIWQHKQGFGSEFTRKYKVHTLVWYEVTEEIVSAIAREKQIKGWVRKKKIKLIESLNPVWKDLYQDIIG